MARCVWETTGKDDEHGRPIWLCLTCGLAMVNAGGESIESVMESLPDCRGPFGEPKRVYVSPPGMIHKAWSYTKALARWRKSGKPVRSDEEVERIYSEICVPCPLINPTKTSCNQCGCRVAADGSALANKIRMATETCEGRWG